MRPVWLLRWAAPALAFVALIAVLGLVTRSPAPAPTAGQPSSRLASRPASLDTEAQIEQLQAAVRAQPGDAANYALLGDAYYQRARETGDPSYYTRADGSFGAALDRDPANVIAISGQATLALARHDFLGGLRLARHARDLAPQPAIAYAP